MREPRASMASTTSSGAFSIKARSRASALSTRPRNLWASSIKRATFSQGTGVILASLLSLDCQAGPPAFGQGLPDTLGAQYIPHRIDLIPAPQGLEKAIIGPGPHGAGARAAAAA